MIKKIIIKDNEAGERLDSFLAKKFPDFSRSYISKQIKDGSILVNRKTAKSSYKINFSDLIEINLIEVEKEEGIKAEQIDLNIIYEDENVIVLNKQPGLVVHPAAGNKEGTLVNALLYYFPKINEAVYQKGNPVSEQRPGLVHRLDKDTSGVMIIAKNPKAMHSLAKQIQHHTVRKTYWAICLGWPKNEEGRLLNYLGRHPKNRKMMADIGETKGKQAISDYKVIQYFKDKSGDKISLVEFDIKTGRTHQIRVQASMIGVPVLGDSVYGNKKSEDISEKLKIKRQLLHAKTLELTLPTNTKSSVFSAPLPEDFKLVLDNLLPIE